MELMKEIVETEHSYELPVCDETNLTKSDLVEFAKQLKISLKGLLDLFFLKFSRLLQVGLCH